MTISNFLGVARTNIRTRIIPGLLGITDSFSPRLTSFGVKIAGATYGHFFPEYKGVSLEIARHPVARPFDPMISALVQEATASWDQIDFKTLFAAKTVGELYETIKELCYADPRINGIRFYEVNSRGGKLYVEATEHLWVKKDGVFVREPKDESHLGEGQELASLDPREIIFQLAKQEDPYGFRFCRTEKEDTFKKAGQPMDPFAMYRLDILGQPRLFLKISFDRSPSNEETVDFLHQFLLPAMVLKKSLLLLSKSVDNLSHYQGDYNASREILHEVLNCLTSIGGWANNLKKDSEKLKDNPAAEKLGKQIESLSQAAGNVFEDTMRLEKIVGQSRSARSEKPSLVNLKALIQENLNYLMPEIEKKKIHCVFDMPGNGFAEGEPLPKVRLTKEFFGASLKNLFNNAIQAMAEGGLLEVFLTYDKAIGRYQIVVKDNGPGIPTSVKERMFEIFNSSKKDGNGIGLYSVKQTMAVNGWNVGYTTGPEGTSFILTSSLLSSPAKK